MISIREESEHMQNYIRDIKVEIHLLTASNKELTKRLNNLEEDLVSDDSDEENETNCKN